MRAAIRQVAITGRVQGVGYRAFVDREARARDLEGWVRNRRDGSVEALFAGPAAAVTAMIEACRRGPSSARVEAVREQSADAELLKLRRAGERFSALPTV
jgi:acylphosphatase